jgi:hypothetical protein
MASITKDEPVLVGSLSAAAVGYVLTFLVAHGVITDTQASTATQTFVPIVTAALIAGLGVLLRRFVSPASKVKAIVEQGLHITDADFGRLEALVEQYGLSIVEKKAPAPVAFDLIAKDQASTTLDAVRKAAAEQTPPPDGMSAGTTTPAP